MRKKTRLVILLVCVACFFVIAPILVLYSMGYRFDFEKMEITSTGGIYVRTYPAAGEIIVDSKITEKPGMFSNSIFVQSLLPKDHTVLVEKSGYYDYLKTIPVQKNQVTKLENVLLIKKNMQFEVLTDLTTQTGKTTQGLPSPFNKQEKFIIKNNNLYYSDAPENSGLPAVQKSTPVLKKILAFALQNNNIIWIGTDGFLYKSDLANLTASPIKLILTPIKIVKTGSYKIINNNSNIFIDNNSNLLFLNTKTNNLDNFDAPVKDAKISPDGASIIFYNDNNIYVSLISTAAPKKNILYKSSEKITDCLWLNNNYIIFTAGNKILISETDYRGNINSEILPQTIVISPGKEINIKNPEIFFNQQDGKLYILTNKILMSSEKITP